MAGDGNKKRKRRKIPGFVFSLISVVLLTIIALMIISGRGISMTWLTGLFSPRVHVDPVQEFHFDIGRDRVFADLGGSLVAAGTLGIQVLDAGGNETLREPFRMSAPALVANNGRAIAFDIGRSAVCVFDRANVLASIGTDGSVVSASINRNGWFCISTQEGGGIRAVATVYNDKGDGVYRAFLATGYILSAVLSPDNRSLAVLNITDNGSRTAFFHGLNKHEPDSSFELTGELIIDMLYLSGGDLLVVTANSLITVDRSGEGKTVYDYSDKRLSGYFYDGGTIILHLLDFGVGYSGRLVSLNENGTLIAESATAREHISMSFGGGYLAVLRNDGVFFYNREFSEFPQAASANSTAGKSRILALRDGAALAASDHSAAIFNVDER